MESQGEEGDSCGRWTRGEQSLCRLQPPGRASPWAPFALHRVAGEYDRRGKEQTAGHQAGWVGERACLAAVTGQVPACRPPPAPCTPTGGLLIGEAWREITTNFSSSGSAQDALTPLIRGSSVPAPVTCLRQAGPGCAPSCLDFLFYFPRKGRAGGGKQPVIGLWKVIACQRRCKLGPGP